MMDGTMGDEFLNGIFHINAVFAGAVVGWIETFSSQRWIGLMSMLKFFSVCGVVFVFFGINVEGKPGISPWAVIAYYSGFCVTFAVTFLLTSMGRRHYVNSQANGGQQ